jgi:hypothetical protein
MGVEAWYVVVLYMRLLALVVVVVMAYLDLLAWLWV